MTDLSRITPLRVVIVGGGIAALECVLALHDLTDSQLRMTLIAPEPNFMLRPLTVAEPFARGHVDALPLEQFMAEHSGRFVRSAVMAIDADAKTVTCASGSDVAYDLLVLAPGASTVPAFTHALTFGAQPLALNGILADLEQGWSKSVAFVVPRGCTWPLPLYELALMTAEQVWSMNMERVAIHFITPEMRPLAVFGEEASNAVAELFEAAGVTLHHGVAAQVSKGGRIETGFGPDLVVDRIVALPLLEGPRLEGVPCNAQGFIPVEDSGLVAGLERVYAIGDATDRPIKQGGLACQQADVTAAHIAATAGADIEVPQLEQVLRGRLLTGMRDRFLRRDVVGDRTGTQTDEPLWWPPSKVSGKYLAPYLTEKDIVHLPLREHHAGPGIDVRVPLTWQEKRQRSDILGLSPLGPTAGEK